MPREGTVCKSRSILSTVRTSRKLPRLVELTFGVARELLDEVDLECASHGRERGRLLQILYVREELVMNGRTSVLNGSAIKLRN